MDDLKLTGLKEEVQQVIKLLEEAFDTLKLENAMEKGFEHCGVQHKQHEDYSITVSQAHYADQLRPMNVTHLRIGKKDKLLEGGEETAAPSWRSRD